MRRLCAVLAVIQLHFAALGVSVPVPDAGPHVNSGWDQTIRFMHLYTTQAKGGSLSYHLQINDDGTVDGSRGQSVHSLLEMRSVAPGVVAIKGYRSGRYLCMERNGRLHGLLSYNEGDCSFEERLLSGTYNVYWSQKYGAAVSLSTRRHRGHVRGRTLPPLSQFLPIWSTPPLPLDSDDESWRIPKHCSSCIHEDNANSMDPLDFTYEATEHSSAGEDMIPS
ncbi:fibroblast growth factor 19 [Hypanus sabinus]|uniref:fibroblast growth factor 19 n=1 Tax=Hypanus sabinus TaxID=79690 RepID=UPI0028C3CE4D|nr:fibroblast growth factor 19 [Hypanus sabinus]